jgi:hypothetical protein
VASNCPDVRSSGKVTGRHWVPSRCTRPPKHDSPLLSTFMRLSEIGACLKMTSLQHSGFAFATVYEDSFPLPHYWGIGDVPSGASAVQRIRWVGGPGVPSQGTACYTRCAGLHFRAAGSHLETDLFAPLGKSPISQRRGSGNDHLWMAENVAARFVSTATEFLNTYQDGKSISAIKGYATKCWH